MAHSESDLSFFIRFWGVRGSHPTPSRDTVKYGGNTACVEVRCGNAIIIFDAGTGIINLGRHLVEEFNRQNKDIVATLLISHSHHDHIHGFPFFAPAYVGRNKLYIMGQRSADTDIAQVLSNSMYPPFFPVSLEELKSTKLIRSISESEVLLVDNGNEPVVRHVFREQRVEGKDPVAVSLYHCHAHPRDGVFVYKIRYRNKTLVYATDVESYDGGNVRLINFVKDADILIHDAQYSREEYADPVMTKQGFGHSTFDMAIENAKAAQVKRLIMFHHDPSHTDRYLDSVQKKLKRKFANLDIAYEGMTIEF